ncbi:MAG: hotdog fold thioesterase [Deltaproteobacteria bacterium]|nr:hotdog fold thioesterase [Deltaproteobacteria bacterium]
MDEKVKKAIQKAVAEEPFARALNLELMELDEGSSVVEMVFDPASMGNIFSMAHGGAIFALIDEAFETACNAYGTVAVALNMNITYIASPAPGARLRAEAKEVSRTRKTGTYEIRVNDQDGKLLSVCQALCYRRSAPLPFLDD